jgi:hypothetical protein
MAALGNSLDWPYIEKWCAQHDALNLLTEAKTKA